MCPQSQCRQANGVELAADPVARQRYREAAEQGDLDCAPIWAGENIDRIDSLESAADLVRHISSDAGIAASCDAMRLVGCSSMPSKVGQVLVFGLGNAKLNGWI